MKVELELCVGGVALAFGTHRLSFLSWIYCPRLAP